MSWFTPGRIANCLYWTWEAWATLSQNWRPPIGADDLAGIGLSLLFGGLIWLVLFAVWQGIKRLVHRRAKEA